MDQADAQMHWCQALKQQMDMSRLVKWLEKIVYKELMKDDMQWNNQLWREDMLKSMTFLQTLNIYKHIFKATNNIVDAIKLSSRSI